MKSYTDLEQSKKLAEFLPLESADMYWSLNNQNHSPIVGKYCAEYGGMQLPAWSLAALLDVLPEGVIENYYVPNLQKENGEYSIAYGNEELLHTADNPIDSCVEMILKLHELKML